MISTLLGDTKSWSLLVPKWPVISTSLSFLNKMELRTVLKMSYESSRTKERRNMQIKRDINSESLLINLLNTFSHLALSPQPLSSVVCKRVDINRLILKPDKKEYSLLQHLCNTSGVIFEWASITLERLTNSCLRAGKSHN